MKLLTLALAFSAIISLPQLSKAQKVNLLAVDGDTAVAYTNFGSLAFVTDKGNTLKEINTPEDLKKSEPSRLFIKGNTIIATKNYGGYFISMNKGTDWKKIILPEKVIHIHCIAMNGSKIYLGTNDGLFVSETNGDKWEKLSGLKKNIVLSLAFDGNTIYAGGEGDKSAPMLFISADNGKTWTKSAKGLPENGSLNYIVLKGSTLSAFNQYSYGHSGVYTYDIVGQTWSLLTESNKFQTFPTMVSMALSDTNYVVSTYDWHYFTSTDKGKTWKMIKTDFPEKEFYGGRKMIYDDGVLYTYTKEGRLFLSKDNGATWSKCKWQADADKVITDAAQAEKDKQNAIYAKQQRYRDSVAAIATAKESNDKILKYYFQGIGEMSYSNYDSALVKFNKAILAKPDFTEAYVAREKCFKAMNQPENAKKDSITAGGLTPDVKANSLFAGHFKLAAVEANKVGSVLYTECYHKDAHGWYIRAKNDYSSERQMDFMWNAVKLDTTKAEYWIFLGDISRDKLYDVAADVHYRRALKLDPNCQWYDFERTRALTCGNCNGKGYRLQVNITQQKVNNTTHSTSDSERIACTQCEKGYVIVKEKFPSVRLVK